MRVHVQALRNDYCHAFVLWFDVGFTQGHKEIAARQHTLTAITHRC